MSKPFADTALSRSPLHIPRIKQEARRLADWTGIPLSRAQELSARLFGATSWQALLQQDSFVPDEAAQVLGRYAENEFLSRRYEEAGALLAPALSVSLRQAAHLLQGWQPTAMHPRFRFNRHWSSVQSEHWKIAHVFGAHESLPPGAHFVWAAGSDGRRGLVAVRAEGMARFIDIEQGLEVVDDEQAVLSPRLVRALDAEDVSVPKYLSQIASALRDPKACLLRPGIWDVLAQPVPRAQLQAAWLTQPLNEAHVLELFAQRMPWRSEDCPGRLKSEVDTFWTMQTPELTIGASVNGPSVYYFVRNRKGQAYFHAGVAAGVGGLRYMKQAEDFGKPRVPGYCLVKYGDQVHGHGALPINEEQAGEIVARSGLNSDTSESPAGLYASEAGLALAKWVAAHPTRARRLSEDRCDAYVGDWWGTVLRRMEFELVQLGELAN